MLFFTLSLPGALQKHKFLGACLTESIIYKIIYKLSNYHFKGKWIFLKQRLIFCINKYEYIGIIRLNNSVAYMIKKISVDKLRKGVYIHDFNAPWIKHPFLWHRGLIKNDKRNRDVR